MVPVQTAPKMVTADFSLKDVLDFTHTSLDTSCVAIWSKLLPELSSGDAVQHSVLHKVIRNYSHVHQFHRMIGKLLQSIRDYGEAEFPCRSLPHSLYDELSSSMVDASEQQMANILGILIEEIRGFYIPVAEEKLPKLKVVVQLTWLVVKNIRVKHTTRLEVLQLFFRHFNEMKEQLIDPLMDAASSSLNLDLAYISILLIHAWADFPLIFKDKFAVSLSESADCLKAWLRLFRKMTIIPETVALEYWLHQCYMTLVILGETGWLCKKRAIADENIFNWRSVRTATEKSMWNENPFSINAISLPVALWHSISSNYAFLPDNLRDSHHMACANTIVSSILYVNGRTLHAAATGQRTLSSVTKKFVAAGHANSLPSLHAAVFRVCEGTLQTLLSSESESTTTVNGKKKRKRRRGCTEDTADKLIRIVNLMEQLGLGFIHSGESNSTFSYSLLWKAFEFILDHKTNWIEVSVTSVEVTFMNLIFSANIRDSRFWLNVLCDFRKLRPKLVKCSTISVLLDCLQMHEFRAFLLAVDSGEVADLSEMFNKIRDDNTVETPSLVPLILDVLLIRLHRPKALQLCHDLLLHLSRVYFALVTQCLLPSDDKSLVKQGANEQWRLCSKIAVSIRCAVTRLKCLDTSKQRLEQTEAQMNEILTSATAFRVLKHVVISDNQEQVDAALEYVSLFIVWAGSCPRKIARGVLKLFTERFSHIGVDDDSKPTVTVGILEDFTEAELMKFLLSKAGDLKISQPPVNSYKDEPVQLWMGSSNSLRYLFSQIFKYCKPSPLGCMLLETSRLLVQNSVNGNISAMIGELFFCQLIVTNKQSPELLKEFLPVYQLLFERICFVLTSVQPDLQVFTAVHALLYYLLRDPQFGLDTCKLALSEPVYRILLSKKLSDVGFADGFEKCSVLLNCVLTHPRLVCPQTVPAFISATSVWFVSILRHACQDSTVSAMTPGRKILVVRLASFVERLFGNMVKHKRFFSKLVIHLIAVYCNEMRNWSLYPEAKEHITAGLYRLLDIIDPHSKQMGNISIGVESREIYKNLTEEHQKFHKYRGLV